MLSIGIVGLPNVGKSTLFKALTKKQVDIKNFPFCTIEPNVGVVEVPDERLQQLAEVSRSAKIVPTAIEFVDIAGLVAGANNGEGLGNQFLANIRETDAIVQVVRAFQDQNIIHVAGQPDPQRDGEIISLELILKDMDTLAKHLPKVEKEAKRGDKEAQLELALVKKLAALFESRQPAKNVQLEEKEKILFKKLNLLSAKPVLYLINNASDKNNLDYPSKFSPALEIDIKLENELSELSPKEAQEMRLALPHPKNSLDELITSCYSLLELETFFTSGEPESRAWTVSKGSKAPQAAGKIHTDFEKGFIRAEVVFWEQLTKAGSWTSAREKGWSRLEGKDYVVKDGDVIVFKFAPTS